MPDYLPLAFSGNQPSRTPWRNEKTKVYVVYGDLHKGMQGAGSETARLCEALRYRGWHTRGAGGGERDIFNRGLPNRSMGGGRERLILLPHARLCLRGAVGGNARVIRIRGWGVSSARRSHL